jgi:hypothetical protein
MNNSMCHNERKIQEYFAWQTMRVPPSVGSLDLSPSDFWFFGYAKERMKIK